MRWPLVSCIMPAHRTGDMLSAAIASFFDQTYEQKELVIVTSNKETREVVNDYLFMHGGLARKLLIADVPLGEMRNIAIRNSDGSFIAHWDSDDVSSPYRIQRSMRELKGCDAVGTSLARFVDPVAKRAWLWDGLKAQGHEDAYLLGGSLCYSRKAYERAGRFDPWQETGEDTSISRNWMDLILDIEDLRDEMLYTATVHPGNTCKKELLPPSYVEIPWEGE